MLYPSLPEVIFETIIYKYPLDGEVCGTQEVSPALLNGNTRVVPSCVSGIEGCHPFGDEMDDPLKNRRALLVAKVPRAWAGGLCGTI